MSEKNRRRIILTIIITTTRTQNDVPFAKESESHRLAAAV